MVLRRQSFAGHTLAVVGFPGAAGAVLVGVSAVYGYFAFCVVAALRHRRRSRGRGGRGRRGVGGHRHRAGVPAGLRLPVHRASTRGFLGGVDLAAVRQLPRHHRRPGARAAGGGRRASWRCSPSSDARCCSPPSTRTSPPARGVPVRLLSTVFLVLLGATAAETSQITGTLLVFALLVDPRGHRADAHRPAGAGASRCPVLIGARGDLARRWSSPTTPPYPIGFWVTSFAFAGVRPGRGSAALAADAPPRSRRRRAPAGGPA